MGAAPARLRAGAGYRRLRKLASAIAHVSQSQQAPATGVPVQSPCLHIQRNNPANEGPGCLCRASCLDASELYRALNGVPG